jgi:hypothetical protein
MSKSEIKTMLISFSYMKGITVSIHYEFSSKTNSQTGILFLSLGKFTAAHSLKNTNSLTGQVKFA